MPLEQHYPLLVCEERQMDQATSKLVVVPDPRRCGVPTPHKPAGMILQKDGCKLEKWLCTVCDAPRVWGYAWGRTRAYEDIRAEGRRRGVELA